MSPEQAAPIFDEAIRQSVIMRLARQVPLGLSGQVIPVTTSKPTAFWTAEGTVKGGTDMAKEGIMLEPKKLAAIVTMSQEVYRANPAGFVDSVQAELAGAFAAAMDAAAVHGVNSPFDVSLSDTLNTITLGTGATVYEDIVAGLGLLAADGKKLNGFAFDLAAEPELLMAVDSSGRPMIQASAAEALYGTLLGRPLYIEEGIGSAAIAGFGGDWSKAVWGSVNSGIQYKVSTEGTVTINGELVSLFENNLVAILAEAEYGFAVADADHFVAYEYAS
jgi:HK97 family phage major capsid protein